MKKTKGGFTLIELLVVIAIIGILATVILASLSTARAKGVDASIKSTISNSRAQATLFYDAHGQTFKGTDAEDNLYDVCGPDADSIQKMVDGATTAGSLEVSCGSTDTSWALSAKLRYEDPNYFCVDSSGKSVVNTTGEVVDEDTGVATCPES